MAVRRRKAACAQGHVCGSAGARPEQPGTFERLMAKNGSCCGACAYRLVRSALGAGPHLSFVGRNMGLPAHDLPGQRVLLLPRPLIAAKRLRGRHL